MKWRNLVFYGGILCALAGLISAIFAETNRSYYIAGVITSSGLITLVLGWIFLIKRSPPKIRLIS